MSCTTMFIIHWLLRVARALLELTTWPYSPVYIYVVLSLS